MPGSPRRPGSVRKTGSKKGPQAGTGGLGRKALRGKGPTPKAEDREYHVAHRRKNAADKAAGQRPHRPSRSRRGEPGSTEYVAGRNSVVEALRAAIPATTLYVAARIEHDERVKEALRVAASTGLALLEVPRAELDRITGGTLHQGLALQVPPYDYAHPDDLLGGPGTPLLVALDGVTDPRNLGAVVRSVAAFGGQGVVVPERRSAGMTTGAWKTSAGAASRVPVARATNLTRALEAYRRAGCFVVGLDSGGDVALPDLAVADQPVVLVVGSEGKGLSRLVRETCDVVASIPMASGTESLNAGVAAGVALYEVARRRREP